MLLGRTFALQGDRGDRGVHSDCKLDSKVQYDLIAERWLTPYLDGMLHDIVSLTQRIGSNFTGQGVWSFGQVVIMRIPNVTQF
jgi:hypothetical protein